MKGWGTSFIVALVLAVILFPITATAFGVTALAGGIIFTGITGDDELGIWGAVCVFPLLFALWWVLVHFVGKAFGFWGD